MLLEYPFSIQKSEHFQNCALVRFTKEQQLGYYEEP